MTTDLYTEVGIDVVNTQVGNLCTPRWDLIANLNIQVVVGSRFTHPQVGLSSRFKHSGGDL